MRLVKFHYTSLSKILLRRSGCLRAGLSGIREEIQTELRYSQGFPGGSDGKESACNAGDLGSIPGKEYSYPLQYSYLESSVEQPGRLQSVGSQRSDMTE